MVTREDVERALRAFGSGIRERVAGAVERGSFDGRFSAGEADRIARDERKTIDRAMIDLLPLARLYARPPVSNFRVGAIVRGSGGGLYLGANLEAGGEALGLTVHAEQSAASIAFMNGEGIEAVAVTAAPCGHCRQFLFELAGGRDPRVLLYAGRQTRLSDLLPLPFGPADLGLEADPARHRKHALIAAPPPAEELGRLALDAAEKSYAPYSNCPSGVALLLESGRVFTGVYIENAAFNPSLPPLQAALAAAAMANQAFGGIVSAALAELENPAVSQRSATRAALGVWAPKADLRLVRARKR
ncbi:MAG: cytidine deaminase [Bryobacteraceae bacterium]|nr:cytidine deaminase [Bryobacteraceae bacterium]